MPGLKNVCNDPASITKCCVCSENDCSISIPPQSKGLTILFLDADEAVQKSKPHCDCIMVLKRNKDKGKLEIYSIELKSISPTNTNRPTDAFEPSKLKMKCLNCIKSTEKILKDMEEARNKSLVKYCIIAIPTEAYNHIKTLLDRIKINLHEPGVHGRIIPCGQHAITTVLSTF